MQLRFVLIRRSREAIALRVIFSQILILEFQKKKRKKKLKINYPREDPEEKFVDFVESANGEKFCIKFTSLIKS